MVLQLRRREETLHVRFGPGGREAVGNGRIVALVPEREGVDDLIGDGTVVVEDPSLTALATSS